MRRKVVWVKPMDRGLFMMDHKDEPLECDICDEKKQLAHINTLGNNVLCICKDCLQEFVNAFKEEDDDGDPYDMSVHSPESNRYLSEVVPHDQPRTWDGLDIDKIQNVRNEIFGIILFDLINPELRDRIKKLMEERLPDYQIKCDEENNPIEVVDSGHVRARVTDTKTQAHIDVIY